MLKKALFILSSGLLMSGMHAAAKKEPVITAIAWSNDSTKVAIGDAQGTISIFDDTTQSWFYLESVEGVTCTRGCRKPYGITLITWLDSNKLKINENLEVNLREHITYRRFSTPYPLCFRCTKHPSATILYEKDIEMVHSMSPDQKLKLIIKSDPLARGKIALYVYQDTIKSTLRGSMAPTAWGLAEAGSRKLLWQD